MTQAVEGEQAWQDTKIISLEIDDYLQRFKNKTPGQYSNDSYRQYRTRFTVAQSWYGSFLADPGWTPKKESRNNKPQQQKSVKKNKFEVVKQNQEPSETKFESSASFSSTIVTPETMINYPFPLLNGQIAKLSLPINLGKKDVERLALFLESLSIDQGKELTLRKDEI